MFNNRKDINNKMFQRKLVLEKDPNVPWMDTMVLNPAIIKKDGIMHMLFRATGTKVVEDNPFGNNAYPICLGYGTSLDNGVTWEFDTSRPALIPNCETDIDKIFIKNALGETVVNHANGCIEDPRLFFVEDTCYLTVACRMFPPGAYWIFDSPTQCAPQWINGQHPYGLAASKNVTVTVLYEVDLSELYARNYEKAFKYITNLTCPEHGENRDVILFPEKLWINGIRQYVMIERPVQPNLNPQFTEETPSIVICAAPSLKDFSNPSLPRKILASPKYPWEKNRIGASAPLVKLDSNTYLLNYHGKQDDVVGYTQSFMVLKIRDNEFPEIIYRNAEGVITVCEEWEEPKNFKIPCIFITGMIKENEEFIFSYGAADESCGIMRVPVKTLLNDILEIGYQETNN